MTLGQKYSIQLESRHVSEGYLSETGSGELVGRRLLGSTYSLIYPEGNGQREILYVKVGDSLSSAASQSGSPLY